MSGLSSFGSFGGSLSRARKRSSGGGGSTYTITSLFHLNNADTDSKGAIGWASKPQAGAYSTDRVLGSHSLRGVFNWTMNGKPLQTNAKPCGVAGYVGFGISGPSVYIALHDVYTDGTHYAYCRVYAYNNTTIRFMLSNRTALEEADDIAIDVTVPISTNTWFWAAIIYDGTTVKCYLDDIKVGEYTLAHTTHWYDTPNPYINGTITSGYLDELVYFDGTTPPSKPSVEFT